MKIAWTLLSVGLLTACVDLGAVRDYAKNSGNALAATDSIYSGWPPPPPTFDHARQVARSQLMQTSAPQFATQLDNDAKNSESFAPLNKSAAQALHLYFGALAAAADTGVVDVSAQAASIDTSLTTLRVESANGKGLAAKASAKAILQLLQIPLDLARQAAVRKLVLASNNDIQVITGYLAEEAKRVGDVNVDAGKTLIKYYDVSYLASRDPAAQALLRGREWNQEASTQTDEDQASKASVALKTIGKDHNLLAQDGAQHLSSAAIISTLTADAPLIEAALKPFLSK
jgi:hypothetical protein